MDDESIIKLYLERSEDAIIETAKKYSGYCRYISNNILHNNEDAEECVNDTYLSAWNSIPPKHPDHLAGYLGKITRNHSLNKYKQYTAAKRGKGDITLVLSELEECTAATEDVESTIDEMILIDALDHFLEKLPKIKRMVFVRRYWYLSTIKDIGMQYGISESKVKSMLFRTRNDLKNYFEKEGIYL